MTVTFGQLDQADVNLGLAGGMTSQLYRRVKFPQSGVTQLQSDDLNRYFERGESVSIRRPRNSGDAEDFDPRAGSDAASAEPGHVINTLTLEKLFTKGFPVYSSDADVATYFRDFSLSTGGTIGKSADDYFYVKAFRDWTTLPTSGTVRIGGHAPIQVVFNESTGGALTDFGDVHLRNADEVLFRNDVPTEGRYARISPTARNAFLGDVTLVSGFAGAMAPQQPGAALLNTGLMDQDVMRRDFMTCGSNAITGQSVVANLGDGTPTDTISAVVADTTLFLDDDQTGSVPLGAVRLTLGITAALNAGIAVGKIARLGPDAGPATAYGVILRVDTSNKYVWLVPYSATGKVLAAGEISTSTDKFGIPAIGSVNTAHHREHLVYASRLLAPPSNGSGATALTARVPNADMVMQIFRGSYNVNRFSESIRSAMLVGVTPSDHRKAVLMLSA